MSTSDQKRSFTQVFSPYLIALIAVGFAIIGTQRFGRVINHTSTIFFCAVLLSSWYGGLLPGLFAAALSCLALDYYFIPPIHSLAVEPEDLAEMVVFGAATFFISWLNSGQRRVKGALSRARRTGAAIAGILVKLFLAVVTSMGSCLAAMSAVLLRSGGSWEDFWITFSLVNCCSALFLIILVSREVR